jgi:hypothetical protein
MSQPDNSITRWECPECGWTSALGYAHHDASANLAYPCDGEPVLHTYVDVDAMRNAAGAPQHRRGR